MFLVNSRFPLVCATPSSSGRKVLHPDGVLLLPKLRRHFAEFLNHSSPDRLGILYPPTCVGLGYGRRVSSLEAFLGSMELVTSPKSARHCVSGLCEGRIYLDLSLRAYPRTTIAWAHLSSCVPSLLTAFQWVGSLPEGSSPLATGTWFGRAHIGTGISTSCASTTPVGLALAPDLPWVD